MSLLTRIAAAVIMPLMLAGCLFQPGKFTSTLDINADRSFAFSYFGEIHAVNMDKISEGIPGADSASSDDETKSDDDSASKPAGMTEAQKVELAETLAKEAGFRRVEYRGDDVWFVDYRISGTMSHSFVFPYNSDAEMMFPFLAVEVRANGTVRLKAPAFTGSSSRPDMSGMGSAMGEANDRIDGEFTVSTDAEIISQTNEEGAVTGPDGRKTIRWRITPQTKTAPMAVLRMRN
jgi:hypothetical protein